MESHKPLNTTPEPPRRSPLLLIIAVLALIGAAAGAFYLGFQKSAIEEEQKVITAEIASLQTEISALQEQKIEAAQLALQWMEQIKTDEILWSRVTSRAMKLIPVDPISQKQLIEVLSYSGSESGKMLINAQTAKAQQEPYEYVAELLRVFNDSSDFYNAVIPSLSVGETDQGEKFITFVMNFDFQKEEPEVTAAEGTEGEQPAATEKEKVSRQ